MRKIAIGLFIMIAFFFYNSDVVKAESFNADEITSKQQFPSNFTISYGDGEFNGTQYRKVIVCLQGRHDYEKTIEITSGESVEIDAGEPIWTNSGAFINFGDCLEIVFFGFKVDQEKLEYKRTVKVEKDNQLKLYSCASLGSRNYSSVWYESDLDGNIVNTYTVADGYVKQSSETGSLDTQLSSFMSTLTITASDSMNNHLFWCEVTDNRDNITLQSSKYTVLIETPPIYLGYTPDQLFIGLKLNAGDYISPSSKVYKGESFELFATIGNSNAAGTAFESTAANNAEYVRSTAMQDLYISNIRISNYNGKKCLYVTYSKAAPNSIMINVQPKNVEAKQGDRVGFSVNATGYNLSYQWEEWNGSSWMNYTGTDAQVNSISLVVNENNISKKYRCIITDANGMVKNTNTVYVSLKEDSNEDPKEDNEEDSRENTEEDSKENLKEDVNDNKSDKTPEQIEAEKKTKDTLPAGTIQGIGGKKDFNFKALNPAPRDINNQIVFADYYAKKIGYKSEILISKDIHAPYGQSKSSKWESKTISWKNTGAKYGDTIYVVWYCQEAHDMQFIKADVLIDGTVIFTIPKSGDVSTISIVKLTK